MNEKDAVTRVICTALDNDLCQIYRFDWGYRIYVRWFGGGLKIATERNAIDTNRITTIGKKRMATILAAIEAARERQGEVTA